MKLTYTPDTGNQNFVTFYTWINLWGHNLWWQKLVEVDEFLLCLFIVQCIACVMELSYLDIRHISNGLPSQPINS